MELPRIKPHKKTITRRKDGSIDVSESDFGPSMTDQSFAEESDVNWIMNRMLKTGEAPHLRGPGRFADLTEVTDLMGAFEVFKTAQEMFQDLPSAVRNKFHNDPLVLEEWLSKPENKKEAVELGLMHPPQSSADSVESDETPILKPKPKVKLPPTQEE